MNFDQSSLENGDRELTTAEKLYEKYKMQLQQKFPEPEEDRKSNDSDDFHIETQIIPPKVGNEFIITPPEPEPIVINSKAYENISITESFTKVKQPIKMKLPALNKQIQTNKRRKFIFKSVDISMQIIKYENISYQIESYFEENEDKKWVVNRTYSDFEWLYNELFDMFPGTIIPSLPQRTVLAKLNILSFTNTIRAQRQKGLEEFLKKVLIHQKLKDLEIVDKFFSQFDQDFRRMSSEYQQQKISAQNNYINTTTSGGMISELVVDNIYKIGKLTTYLLGVGKNEQKDKARNMEEYFKCVDKEMRLQQQKLRRIKESCEMVATNKLEYIKVLQGMTGVFQELERELDKIESVAISCEQTANTMKEMVNKQNNDINYILEQLILDIDVIFQIINRKSDLQSIISYEAAAMTNSKYSEDQKEQIKSQLVQNQKTLNHLIENFKEEYENYCSNCNQQLNDLIQKVSEMNKEQASLVEQIWYSDY